MILKPLSPLEEDLAVAEALANNEENGRRLRAHFKSLHEQASRGELTLESERKKWMAQSEKDRRAAERDRERLVKERDAAQAVLEASDFVLKEERKKREAAEQGLWTEKRNSAREHENFRAAMGRAGAAEADNAAHVEVFADIARLLGAKELTTALALARGVLGRAHPGAALLEELRRLREFARIARRDLDDDGKGYLCSHDGYELLLAWEASYG